MPSEAHILDDDVLASPESEPETGSESEPGLAGPSLQRGLFPMRLLGMSLWIVWLWCMHMPPTLLVGTSWASSLWDVSDLSMRAGDITALVAFALLARRLGSLDGHPRLVASGLASILAGTAGLVLGLNGVHASEPLMWASGIFAGFGEAVLFLWWAEAYCRLRMGDVLVYGSLSCVCAGGVPLVVSNLEAPLPLACTFLAPTLSYLLCWFSSSYLDASREDEAGNRTEVAQGRPRPVDRYPFPWKPMLIMALAGFAAGFSSFALFGQSASTRSGATLVVGLAMTLSLLLFRDRTKPAVLAKTALALVTAGLVVLAFAGSEYATAASWLIMLAYIGICVFSLSLLANLTNRYALPPLWLFGWGRAASELMMSLGSYAGHVPLLAEIPSSPFLMAAMSAVGLAAVCGLVVMWMSEQSFTSGWAVEPVVAASSGGEANGGPDPRVRLETSCAKVAGRFGLTAREEQILILLLEGCSYQEVCQSLLLSISTVKTHVRHLYGKLGVHARAEALELVLASEA